MSAQLRYQLIQYLGVATGRFNSGFSSKMEYEDSEQVKRTTTMFTWFLPPAFQFPEGYETEIGEWHVKKSTLTEKNIIFEDSGRAPFQVEEYVLFLPKGQKKEWAMLCSLFGEPIEKLKGYLTPSGRSFWVTGNKERAFGLKFHIKGEMREELLLGKALDMTMITNSVVVNEKLSDDASAMTESYGCFLTLNPNEENPLQIGYLYRDFKWDQIQMTEGDVFLPLTALLSQALWTSDELRNLLSLPPPPQRMSDWFVSELAPHFAEAIENSLFKTGIHAEFHQQNITVHLRDGKVKRVIFQDLQDCLYDPITRFLIRSKGLVTEGTELQDLETRRLLALPGEILTPDNFEKLSVQLGDWWRRWIRIFGRYDRIINMLSGDHLFESNKFENAIATRIQATCHNLGLNIPAIETMDLYQLISSAQFVFQQKLLSQLLQASDLEIGDDLPIFEKGMSLSTARAPWNRNLFLRRIAEEDSKILKFSKLNKNFMIVKGKSENHLYYYRDVLK